MMDGVGYCRFCGQSMMVRYTDRLTQEEINTLATDACKCEAARKESFVRHKARNARYMVSRIVGPYSKSADKAMRYLADAVARDELKKVTIRIDDRHTANMAAGQEISVTIKETNVTTQADVEDSGEDARDGIEEVEAADE